MCACSRSAKKNWRQRKGHLEEQVKQRNEGIVMNSVYKCRLCGEKYCEGGTSNKKIALSEAIAATLNKEPEPNAPTMLTVHICKDGSYGICDFQGMEMEV